MFECLDTLHTNVLFLRYSAHYVISPNYLYLGVKLSVKLDGNCTALVMAKILKGEFIGKDFKNDDFKAINICLRRDMLVLYIFRWPTGKHCLRFKDDTVI